MNILSIKNITVNFGEKNILNGIDLDIAGGTITALSGSSGSGKTTLLSVISGLLKPDSGKVFFKGKNIYKWMDLRRSGYRNRNVGFVFQSFNLLDDLTVYQNILYPAILNFRAGSDKKEIMELMKYLGLFELKNQYPSTISGGEKQRTAIARAIINKPQIILADEPTGNLDEKTAKNIFKLFQDIKKKYDIAFLIVTHDNYIIKKSDFHYYLDCGRVAAKKT